MYAETKYPPIWFTFIWYRNVFMSQANHNSMVTCLFFQWVNNFIGPVNLGNPKEFTILELAREVVELTGSESPIIFKPLPHDDPKQRKPEISLAKQELGWEPRIQLKEGLGYIIEYFKEYLKSHTVWKGRNKTPKGLQRWTWKSILLITRFSLWMM